MVQSMEPANGQAAGPILFDPQRVTTEWAASLGERLENSSWAGVKGLAGVLPAATAIAILDALCKALKQEPTLVEVVPPGPQVTVTVVGDTHGQLHDVLAMLRQVGMPSTERMFVFNGDFVDRGAWGVEVLLVLAAWKLAAPGAVSLLRGNHESATCTALYGFRGELEAKYGRKQYKGVYSNCLKAFAVLPLAALIAQRTLVVHGGLFRKPQAAAKHKKGGNKRKRGPVRASDAELLVGSLDDLRCASKGGRDPNGAGSTVIATDVMWSDPVATAGITTNDARGVGLIFGPDVTKQFLEDNNLRLIIRSHEGPDARFKRDDMPNVDSGHAVDHSSESGQLMTVFSAPDYPQFQDVPATERYGNTAAVAVLIAPDYATPVMHQFRAVLPRPEAEAYYEYQELPDSDEEIELGTGTGVSDMSASELSLGGAASERSMASGLSTASVHADSVDSAAPRSDVEHPGMHNDASCSMPEDASPLPQRSRSPSPTRKRQPLRSSSSHRASCAQQAQHDPEHSAPHNGPAGDRAKGPEQSPVKGQVGSSTADGAL